MDSERKMLLDDRSRLMGELHSVLMKILRLKSYLENSNAETILVENKRFQMTENIQIRRQRVALLGLYMKKGEWINFEIELGQGKDGADCESLQWNKNKVFDKLWI